MVDVDDSSL